MDNSERTDPTESTKRRIKRIGAAAILLGALGLGVYVYNFRDRNLSASPEHWGQFGDYLAGVLNPIFALGALIALLWTIILQSKELADSRKALEISAQALNDSKEIAAQQAGHFEMQAKKEDVYRMIKDVYSELNSLYRSSTSIHLQTWVRQGAAHTTTSPLKSFFGDNKNMGNYTGLVEGNEKLGQGNHSQLKPLGQLLVELRTCLEQFERLAKDTIVTGYYKRRYRQVCIDMYGKGYLDVGTVDFYRSDDPAS